MQARTLTYILLLFVSSNALAEKALQDKLINQVIAGSKCEQIPNNGRYCQYTIGDKLSFSIKDVGGTDTVVGFHYSNINEKLYAVYYFNCIVVVPGHSHPNNYDLNYAAYVSPKNGQVYKSKQECQSQ